MKEYKFSWGRIFYLEEDIICVEYADDLIVDEDGVMEFYAVFTREAENKQLKILVLPGKNTSATPEAREFSQRSNLNCTAEAIVVNSLAQRIISNFYISFKSKADYPIKMFNSKDEALKWLRNF